MRVEFKPSFYRSLKAKDPSSQQRVQKAVAGVLDYYAQGVVTPGLGVTHLRGAFWEARVGLQTRLLWRRSKDLIEFVLVGSHDEVKRFLKRV